MGTRAARFWIPLLLIVQIGFLFPTAASAGKVPIAVIVHERVPVDELSLPELRRIFLGSRQSWSEELAQGYLLCRALDVEGVERILASAGPWSCFPPEGRGASLPA